MKRAFSIGIVATAALLFAGRIAVDTGVRLNFTDSGPSGLWIERPLITLERGILVSICPPNKRIVELMVEHGALPHGNCTNSSSEPLLKTVAALTGDTVILRTGQPAIINGRELPNTAARQLPAWPDGKYTVGPNEIWIFSTYSGKSFDSRYFGPVPVRNIRGQAKPLLVDGHAANMTRGIIK